MKISGFLILFVLIGSFLPAGLSVEVIHVPTDQPTIQSAIGQAGQCGDTILVAPGIYEEYIDFLEKEVSVKSESCPELTTIQGGQPDLVSAFFCNGNGLSLSNQRYSGAVLPLHAKFVALNADDPAGSIVEVHASGQAFSQALAEVRIVNDSRKCAILRKAHARPS